MTRRFYLTEDADNDFAEQYVYFSENAGVEVADRFFAATRSTFDRLVEMPEIGRHPGFLNPQLSDIRVWQVKGFEKYLIFYRILHDEIEILRIIHGSRDIPTIFKDII